MHCNAVSPLKVLESMACIWYRQPCFSSSSLFYYYFYYYYYLNGTWFCWLQLILHNLKYRSMSSSHPSGNCGLCQNIEIQACRQCWAFAALVKRVRNAAAGSSEVPQEEEAVVPKHVWNLPSDDDSEAVTVLYIKQCVWILSYLCDSSNLCVKVFLTHSA